VIVTLRVLPPAARKVRSAVLQPLRPVVHPLDSRSGVGAAVERTKKAAILRMVEDRISMDAVLTLFLGSRR